MPADGPPTAWEGWRPADPGLAHAFDLWRAGRLDAAEAEHVHAERSLTSVEERARAAARLREACMRHPWHVAGTGRFCTEVMQKFGSRLFLKTGAEGVYCAALPELGIGIAVKCDDGAGRAAEVMMAATLDRLLNNDADSALLKPFVRPELRNWNGFVIGDLRPTEAFNP